MKKFGFAVAVCSVVLTLATNSFAGTMQRVSKEFKAPIEEPTCFGDQEFQVDVFGAYADTKTHQGGIIREHGWGGGIGLNYFFTRYFGLGVEGYWLDAKQDERIDGFNPEEDSDRRAVHSATGSIYLRYPIDRWCLAPYIYFGGGGHWDSTSFGSAHWGGGLEYRIVPQRVGIFVDGRFTALADKSDVHIHNPHFTLIRAGLRFVF